MESLNYNELFGEMTKCLKEQSDRLAFLLSRNSSESFVVEECAWAIHQKLTERKKEKNLHVHIEEGIVKLRKYEKNDLILVPVDAFNTEQLEKAYVFEFKMDWPGGFKENPPKIVADYHKLSGLPNAFVIVFYYAFLKMPHWTQYWKKFPEIFDWEDGRDRLLTHLRHDIGKPAHEGEPFNFENSETSGRAGLLVWRVKS